MAETAVKNIQKNVSLSFHQLYQGIMDSIPSSVLIVDNHLSIISANRNFYLKSRRNKTNTIGQKLTDVFPKVLLDYTRMGEKIRRVLLSGNAFEGGEMEYRAPGLPTRVYYYRITPLENKRGEVEQVILLMDDVTERKRLGEKIRRTEEHLARVVDSANDMIVSTDSKGRILSWNNTLETVTGHSAKKVEGKPFNSVLTKTDGKSFGGIVSSLNKGQRVIDKELCLFNKTGEDVDVSWSFSTILDETGEATGFVIVGRDLTERKEMEARLNQSAKMASLGTMAGGVAHEIRNPLAIIDSTAQILKGGPKSASRLEQGVQKIRTASKRASDIVDSLLTFARQSEFSPELTNIGDVIDDTLILMKNQLSLQHIVIHTRIAQNLPRILGNPTQLQQVFMNFLLNACNAIGEGGNVYISAGMRTNHLSIKFRDDGKGIPSKYLSRIFDPFFTTQPVGKGTGLGLAVSYSIISQHNGTIDVKSEVRKGAVFTVSLPVPIP